MEIKVKFLIRKRLPAGEAFYWEPSKDLIAAGFKRQGLGKDEAAAIARARLLNTEAEAWRQAKAVGAAPKVAGQTTVREMIAAYQACSKFTRLAAGSRSQYSYALGIIDRWCGDAPARSITRQMAQKFYHTIQPGTPSMANTAMTVAAIAFKFGWDTGVIDENPFTKAGLIAVEPRLRVWSRDDIALFTAAADRSGLHSMGDAICLAVWTAQRLSDVLGLTWGQAAGGRVRLRQTKRRAQMDVPAVSWLAARLAQAQARRSKATAKDLAQPIVTYERTGQRYTRRQFTYEFGEVRELARLAWRKLNRDAVEAKQPCPFDDLHFQDLRDTAITWLATAGCTIPQICSISGHSENSAGKILKHYLALNAEMADTAMAKLQNWAEGASEPPLALPAPKAAA